MRDWWKWCWEYRIFLIMLLVMDLFTGGFLWLMDARSFGVLFLLFVGVSLLLFVTGAGMSVRNEKRRQHELQRWFLDTSGEQERMEEISVAWKHMPSDMQEVYQLAYDRIWELEQREQSAIVERKEYEDYIEIWAHEIKVPLSLLTLLLENRKGDMSAVVYEKLQYTDRRMQEYVTQILYYARLKAVHKDYVLESVDLCRICKEVVGEYAYMDATPIQWQVQVGTEKVLTDRKGLQFMIGQILNNACKYIDREKENSYVKITSYVEPDMAWLQVEDNGIGAVEEEIPFLFDKGFTGKTVAGQAKATGMGLYLVGQMAKDLSLQLDIESKRGEGFTIRIGFPVIYR